MYAENEKQYTILNVNFGSHFPKTILDKED